MVLSLSLSLSLSLCMYMDGMVAIATEIPFHRVIALELT